MLEFISEIGSSFKWVYRGLLYFLSSSYQQRVLIEYSKRGAVWKVFDIIMSVVFMGLEILLVFYLTRQL